MSRPRLPVKKRSRFRRNASVAVAVAVTVTVPGCVQILNTTAVRALDPASTGTDSIRSPVKAHLKDGSTVVFTLGATIHNRLIEGTSMSYPLMSRTGSVRSRVPLDSVVGLEAFETKQLGAESLVWTVAVTAATALAFWALVVEIGNGTTGLGSFTCGLCAVHRGLLTGQVPAPPAGK